LFGLRIGRLLWANTQSIMKSLPSPPSNLRLAAVSVFMLILTFVYAQPIHLTAPERMVEKLNGAVGLTPAQQLQAGEIFRKATAAILPLAPIETEKRFAILKTMREEIRAILTPQQWMTYALTPQSKGGGQQINVENMVDRLDRAVALTPTQKTSVREIFEQYAEERAMLPEDEQRARKSAALRQASNTRVRALLTPEQQQKYAATPISDGGGKIFQMGRKE
jgi:hypothetical protein